MTLSQEQIDNLPVGASYQAQDGNATGTVKKTDKGIEFTANCDSLNILIKQLTKEVYRFQSENTALVTKSKEQKTVGLTVWQSIQIKGFRILVPITIVLLIVIFYKFNIWQNLRKLLKMLLK
ncbi:hypothetical protein [Dysgonomonas sp. ZJ279]|uniref:hypothetical protein n=1 Tax=Dysgonomonas sp. ZJ279 TaxID=2709796 RepID=UPI0013ED0B85|nr:hypothetical protein [Dysgonomonas sp. ZJ279]